VGVGAFSENGGFWGFRRYKSSSVFGGKIGEFGLNLVWGVIRVLGVGGDFVVLLLVVLGGGGVWGL